MQYKFKEDVQSVLDIKRFDIDYLIDHYEVLHTQSEEYVIDELLKVNKLTEDIFDEKKRLKESLRKNYK